MTDKYQCDVIIVTVDDTEGYDPTAYAKQIYTEYDMGYGDEKSGVMFLVSMAERDYVLLAYGYGNTAFTDYGKEQLENTFLSDLSAGNYFNSFFTYIKTCGEYLELARSGKPLDAGNSPERAGKVTLVKTAVCILVPLAIALCVCLYFRKQMKTAVSAREADAYIPEDGFHVTGSDDIFLYCTEIRQVIEDKLSSDGTTVDSDGFSSKSGKF